MVRCGECELWWIRMVVNGDLWGFMVAVME